MNCYITCMFVLALKIPFSKSLVYGCCCVQKKRTSLCACVLMVSLSYLLQLWQAGRQSTQKFVNMYGHIDVLRPYFDSDPHEIRKR